MTKTPLRIALLVAGVATATGVTFAQITPGPNKVKYPADWNKQVLYATVDRPDVKQYRELYTTQNVIDSARAGRPIPNGAVLTLAAYKAKVDAAGNPVKDSNGRFIKDELAAVNVMEKGQDWGSDIPTELRNGDWLYQSFLPNGSVNDKANLKACFECHKPFDKDDYLTNLAKLAGKFPSEAKAGMAAPGTITIAGFIFGPGKLAVTSGQSVTWTNGDDSPHQVTFQKSGQRTGVMLKGQSQSVKFDDPGVYDYICGLHPGMKGTVEVSK